MVDVLYIKGKASPNNDQEMKYSLRSMESFTNDVDRVFITGNIPDYIDQTKVIYTPEEDIGSPMINHWWKVTQTIRKTDIGENFLLMYDDIFFKKQTRLTNYPFYKKGKLGESATGGFLYKICLTDAREWLKKNGYTTYDCELHVPCIYNKNNFLSMAPIFEEQIHNLTVTAVRSMYANIFLTEYQEIKDVKIRDEKQKVEDIQWECFSVSDQAYRGNVENWLTGKFTRKSRWEK